MQKCYQNRCSQWNGENSNTSNLSLRSQLASSTSLHHSILSLLVVVTSSATVLSSFFSRSNPTKHHTETTAIVRTITKTKLLILGIVENAGTSTATCEKLSLQVSRNILLSKPNTVTTQEIMSNIFFYYVLVCLSKFQKLVNCSFFYDHKFFFLLATPPYTAFGKAKLTSIL